MEHADWHPAPAAAWVHVALAAIHPFRDGNGRTARILASLVMYRGGFKDTAFTSLEECWGKNTASYYGAFACLGDRFSPTTDVTPFVRVHTEAQVAQVLELALRQRVDGVLWTTLENLLEDHGLPSRLANALYDSFSSCDSRRRTTPISSTPASAPLATIFRRRPRQGSCSRGTDQRAPLPPGRRLLPAVAKLLALDASSQFSTILDELDARAQENRDPLPSLHREGGLRPLRPGGGAGTGKRMAFLPGRRLASVPGRPCPCLKIPIGRERNLKGMSVRGHRDVRASCLPFAAGRRGGGARRA